MLTTAISNDGLQLSTVRRTQYDRLSQQQLSFLYQNSWWGSIISDHAYSLGL